MERNMRRGASLGLLLALLSVLLLLLSLGAAFARYQTGAERYLGFRAVSTSKLTTGSASWTQVSDGLQCTMDVSNTSTTERAGFRVRLLVSPGIADPEKVVVKARLGDGSEIALSARAIPAGSLLDYSFGPGWAYESTSPFELDQEAAASLVLSIRREAVPEGSETVLVELPESSMLRLEIIEN